MVMGSMEVEGPPGSGRKILSERHVRCLSYSVPALLLFQALALCGIFAFMASSHTVATNAKPLQEVVRRPQPPTHRSHPLPAKTLKALMEVPPPPPEDPENLPDAPPSSPADPEGPSGSEGEGCEPGLYPQDKFVGFEEGCLAHQTSFLIFWTCRTETFFEFPLHLLYPSPDEDWVPLQLSVGAIFANGDMAHMDAMTRGDNPVLNVMVDLEKSVVDIQAETLSINSASEEYQEIMKTHSTTAPLAKLPIIGIRKTAECAPASVLVQADDLISTGLLTGVGAGEGPSILEQSSVKAFPQNLDLTVSHGSHPAIRFCLFKLPDKIMVGRPADDRVGYFDIPWHALGDFRGQGWPGSGFDPTVRLIQRQRLRKNPDTGKLEIRVHIDHTVPKTYRAATKRGVQKWNEAFKLIGLPDAVQVLAPGDEGFPKDYDVGDVRFSSISWATGEPDQGAFAIGQSVTDPRSGEILKANIVFTLGWLTSWLGEALLYHGGWTPGSPAVQDALKHADLVRRASARRLGSKEDVLDRAPSFTGVTAENFTDTWLIAKHCEPEKGRSFRHRHPHSYLACRSMMDSMAGVWTMAKERTSDEVQEFLEEGIADVASHEYGHVLGLRHNFEGSTAVSFDQLLDPEHTGKHGLSSSVMDYLPTNLFSKRAMDAAGGWRKLHFFNPVVGAYDKFVIKYGYTIIPGEKCCAKAPELKAIAEEYQRASFTFATDEDAAHDLDPHVQRHDMAGDPVRWFLDRIQLVNETQEDVLAHVLVKGEPYEELAKAQVRLFNTLIGAGLNLNRFVGGFKISRHHAEQCTLRECRNPEGGGKVPFVPLPWQRQLEALEGAMSIVVAQFGEGAWPRAPTARYCLRADEGLGKVPLDLGGVMTNIKKRILKDLLDPARFKKLQMAEWMGDIPMLKQKVLRVISRLLFGVPEPWEPNGPDEEVAKATAKLLKRREMWNEQLFYLQTLVALAGNPDVSEGVTISVTSELLRIKGAVAMAQPVLGEDMDLEQAGFIGRAMHHLR